MKTQPIGYDPEIDPLLEQESESLELPKPDSDNITVFTHNLPNKPILPWNHYDSPWEEEQQETTKATEESKTEIPIGDRQESEEKPLG